MTRWYDEAEQILDIIRAEGLEGEVFCAGSEREPVKFEDNELKMMESSTRLGFAVRLVENGRVGFAAATGPGAGRNLVDKARAVARFGSAAEFEFPTGGRYPEVDTYDERVANLPASEMVGMGKGLVEGIRSAIPDAQVGVSVSRGTGTVRLMNTAGLDLLQSSTSHGVGCQATVVGDDGLLHTGDSTGGHQIVRDADEVLESVLWQIRSASRTVRMEDGTYPVIFAPMALGDILRPLLACSDGDAVDRGISPWRDAMGERLFDERLNLVDDGILPDGAASAPSDDEGVPSQTTPILEDGVLRNYLLDLKTARRLDMSPTGNGFRGSTGSLPAIAPSNLVIGGGDASVRELKESLPDGLLVLSLMGAWGGNPYAGRVSGNVNLGYRISRGQILGRVKDCMLYVDVFEALKDGLIGMSQERELRHSTLFPHVALDGVSISSG
ncbi:MAG: TldD/PmbA family protein [Clostridia bacterium]